MSVCSFVCLVFSGVLERSLRVPGFNCILLSLTFLFCNVKVKVFILFVYRYFIYFSFYFPSILVFISLLLFSLLVYVVRGK